MLMLTITNDNDIASKFKVTIHILFVFGQIIVLIIRIWPNSKDPLFGIALPDSVRDYLPVAARSSTNSEYMSTEPQMCQKKRN